MTTRYTTTIDISYYVAGTTKTYTDRTLYLELDGNGSATRKVYIWFPLPVSIGSTIVDAVLQVALYEAWAGGPHTITAKRITEAWSVATQDVPGRGGGFTPPAVSATNAATVAITAGGINDTHELDLTAMLQDVAGGAPWYGVELSLDTSGTKRLWSSEGGSAALVPQLFVTENLAVSPPRNLIPNASRAVSLTRPILLWEYVSTGVSQGESRVQLDTASDFASPDYDSGWVANTLSLWDLAAAPSPPTLADNTQYWWRVAVRSVDGIESDWSDVATFFRRSKGVLTITAPAADNDDVDEATPTFSHTFTGRTQQTVQHLLYHRDSSSDPWELFFADDPTVSGLTDWTLPQAPADLDGDFRFRLRVWDTIDRIATSNDPTYVEADRVYQYAPTAGVDPVTDLAGSASGPQITLTWTRTGSVSFFHLLVDGKLKRALIPAADVLVSGDDYSLVYWSAGTHDYSIVAVSSALKSSISNPEVEVSSGDIRGIWLVAEDEGIACVLLGQEPINTQLGEDVAVFYPRGRRIPVLISSAVRGLEGEASGILAEYNGVSAAEWLENFRTIKGLPRGAAIRLLYGHKSFPILIGQASETERPTGEVYLVRFSFYQSGEFDIEQGSI